MVRNGSITLAQKIMSEFVDATALAASGDPSRRYLWTDAFAICNFLEIFKWTGDKAWRKLAIDLVDQVHRTLGRHRDDDRRCGWISGLSDEEGVLHPTRGGLRIGKLLSERLPGERVNERLEWDRDGQYYHYLTKWMHALNRIGQATGEPLYLIWALELAQAVHSRFTHLHPGEGRKRIYWKMSIDLRRPLVAAMGQHDPLDGLVTYRELEAAAGGSAATAWPGLSGGIADLEDICREEMWITDDPLGLGGLLFDAWRMAQLMMTGNFSDMALMQEVLEAAVIGLGRFAADNPLKYRARQRLAFRELGLAIGLKGITKFKRCVIEHRDLFEKRDVMRQQVETLAGFAPLAEIIERFWLNDGNREAESWQEHREINMVMLATSLAPDEFLKI